MTDIVSAMTCPRLFWFSRVEGRTSLLGARDGEGVGRRVHALVQGFEKTAPSSAELQAAFRVRPLRDRRGRVQGRLEEVLYREVLLPEVTREREGGREDGRAALAMWRALRSYAATLTPYLVDNSRALAPDAVLRRTLLASELEVRLGLEVGAQGRAVEVRGRADSLWFDHARDRALLIEYKTRPVTDTGEDFLQVALYHWLLEAGNGVSADARVLDLLGGDPDRPEARRAPRRGPRELARIRRHGELEGHLESMLGWMDWSPGRGAPPPGPQDPALCERCPVQAECFRRIPRRARPAVRASPSEPPPPPPPAPSAPPARAPGPAAETSVASGGEEGAGRVTIRLGSRRDGGEPVEWYPNDTSVFVNPNLAILGTMGTGKTQCTRSVLYQLVRARHESWGAPERFLIFDYKGDYADPAFAEAVGARVLPAHQLPFNPLALPSGPEVQDGNPKPVWSTLSTFVDSLTRAMGLGQVQAVRLLELLEEAFEDHGIRDDDPGSWRRPAPTIGQVAERFLAGEPKKDKLYRVLLELSRSELFDPDPASTRQVWDAIEGVTVLDLRGGISESLQDLTVATVLDQVHAGMHLRGDATLGGPDRRLRALRMMLLVDEADTFMSKEFPILRRLLKEGRSFGVGVILSTQFLRHFVTRSEKYFESFSSWVIHQFDGLRDAQVREAFGVHGAAEVRSFREALERCRKHQSLARLDQEGAAERAVIEMDDLPYYRLVEGSSSAEG